MPLPRRHYVMRRASTVLSRLIFALALALLTLVLPPSFPAHAQTGVDQSDPPLEGTVTVAPDRVSIWFEQPVAAEPAGPSVQIVDSAGAIQPTGPATIYSLDPRHVTVPVSRTLPPGSYSVLWTVHFEDEQQRSGAFGFRIGGAGQPGAATTLDAWPATWALIARFLTLLGIALAFTGLILTRPNAVQQPATVTPEPSVGWLVPVGAGLALIGALATPAFEALFTLPSMPVVDVVRSYPVTWWLAAGALLLIVPLGIATATGRAPGRSLTRYGWLLSVVLSLLALAGTLFSVATAATGSPAGGVIGIALALLQGLLTLVLGLALAAAAGPFRSHTAPGQDAATRPEPGSAADPALVAAASRAAPPGGLGSPSWLVAALAVVALAAAVAAGSQAMSGPGDLLERLFGQVLLTLGLLLVIVIGLWIWAWRRDGAVTRWSIATLGALGLGAAVLLALLAPPNRTIVPASLVAVNLVEPSPATIAGQPGQMHLLYQPATDGANAFVVWQATAEGVTQPEPDQAVAITLTALDQDTPPIAAAPGTRTGAFTIATATLPSAGWWQADVAITPAAGGAVATSFFLLLPDPNVTGYGPPAGIDPAAQAVFARGLAAMTSLRQVQFSMMLGGGSGTFARSEIAINEGDATSPQTYREEAAAYETITIGNQQWFRRTGEEWTERQAGSLYVPAEWGETYARATGFTLGPVVEVGGEPAQVVTFWLPRQDNPRQEPAWFAWWVGTETGQVHRETMVSTRHYMQYDFGEFNQPITIEPPAGA